MIYPCNGILFTHKKNETLACFTTWIGDNDLMLTESDTKGYIRYDTIYINSSRTCRFTEEEDKC